MSKRSPGRRVLRQFSCVQAEALLMTAAGNSACAHACMNMNAAVFGTAHQQSREAGHIFLQFSDGVMLHPCNSLSLSVQVRQHTDCVVCPLCLCCAHA